MIFNINSFTGQPEISNEPPEFTYSGDYSYNRIGDSQNWDLKILTSGVLTFTKFNNAANGLEVFLAGGGGGGGNGYGTGGGGGGYTTNTVVDSPEENVQYFITIGEGGTVSVNGGATKAFGASALGGLSTAGYSGGSGGSGGGAGGYGDTTANKSGGSNGNNGSTANRGVGGTGQGTTTHPFNDSRYPLYCGGGGGTDAGTYAHGSGGEGGGGAGTVNATPNTGGGGGSSGAGGSGIVIIRNKRMEEE